MYRILAICLLALISISLQAQTPVDNEIEYLLGRTPAYLEQGIREYRVEAIRNQYHWPFQPFDRPSPVGHVSHSYQNYNGSPYFHPGVDIRVPASTEIYSSTGGTVVNIENYISGNSLYWEVAIRDEQGFLWQYHHVDRSTIPQAIFTAYQNGSHIAPQTLIGNVVYWPVQAYGMNFHHIHLNVLDGNGNYLNPFLFLIQPQDCTSPNLGDVYFLRNEGTSALSASALSGDVDIVVRAEDLMDSQPYQLTIYKMEYEIQNASGQTVVPRTTLWQFDKLPGGNDMTAHVNTVFKSSFTASGKELSTSGNYSRREFYYVVTNQVNGVVDTNGCWHTAAKDAGNNPLFPDGAYRVTIHATDFNANTVAKTVGVQVKNQRELR